MRATLESLTLFCFGTGTVKNELTSQKERTGVCIVI